MIDVSIMDFAGKSPRIHPSAFIAPGCRIIGDVAIGEDASIWYNCVLRGDVSHIRIGARSNVQDGTIIHCEGPKPGSGNPEGCPALIGADVLIGHRAIIHGCTIEDRAFVGMGALVMDGCHLEPEAMLGAGALLSPGKRIARRQLWLGQPARYGRDLDDAALASMARGTAGYVLNGKAHRESLLSGTPQ